LKPSETKSKKTVVVGAGTNPSRYASIAMNSLLNKGHEVVPIGLRKGNYLGLEILTGTPPVSDVHTVTLYIRPEIQKKLYDYLLSLKPARIIFNPGTENPEFEKMARQQGIETLEACTLVMLSIGAY
jgi:uncharacterized protein